MLIIQNARELMIIVLAYIVWGWIGVGISLITCLALNILDAWLLERQVKFIEALTKELP